MTMNPRYLPNYEGWLRKDVWALGDAVCLLLNVEPLERKSFTYNNRKFKRDYPDALDTASKASGRTLEIEPAYYVGSTVPKVKPDVFIKWAEVKGYEIPEPFQSLLASDNDLISNDALGKLRKSPYWQSLEAKAIKVIEEFPEWERRQRTVKTTGNMTSWIKENTTKNTREIQILINVLSEIYSINK